MKSITSGLWSLIFILSTAMVVIFLGLLAVHAWQSMPVPPKTVWVFLGMITTSVLSGCSCEALKETNK